MLIEFSVGNFRSFKEVVTLSMVATKLISKERALDENNVFEAPGAPPLLTSAAIYGANASGKSNLVTAIAFMREFILTSTQETRPTGAIPVERFRLSAETVGKPSHFEMVFVVEERRYRYGFDVTREAVVSEWLYVVPTTREALLFMREGNEVKLGERFKEGRDLMERTRPNALFLSVVAQFNGPTAQRVTGWFRNLGIASGLKDIGMRLFTHQKMLDGEYRDEIVELVRRLDLGIHDLRVEAFTVSSDEMFAEVPEDIRELFARLFESGRGEVEGVRVLSVHPLGAQNGDQAGEEVFDFDEYESEGTKKLFAMAGPLVKTLRTGGVLIVDELDARLHPLMTREIVGLFNSRKTNPKHAQLIFTTQDTNLLDRRLLRRDQIWFTEKDRQGATHLYSLAEFKVRNDASFRKDYIQGRYGAIPFLGDLSQVLEVE